MQTLSVFLRICEILIVGILYSFLFGFRLFMLSLTGEKYSFNALVGEYITVFCERLGATFVKIGQVLSSRPDILPEETVKALARLQDRTAPIQASKVPRLVELSLGVPIADLFASFEFEPIACASIAQVHRAVLKTGEKVAVKIRRPDLKRFVRNDLAIIHFIAHGLSYLPAFRLIPLKELLVDFGEAIYAQLDFRIEVKNNRQFQDNFADIPSLKFPTIYSALCTESAIVMEFLDDLIPVSQLGKEEGKIFSIVSLRALYKMIFVDGFIHVDLHPGNIFFRRNSECVILDLGLVSHFDEQDKQDFVDFFFATATNDGKECAQIIYKKASYIAEAFDWDRFEQEVISLIDVYSKKNALEFEVTSFVFELFNLQRRSGLRGTTSFIMAIFSLVVFEGIIKQVYPDLDFQSEALDFLLNGYSTFVH